MNRKLPTGASLACLIAILALPLILIDDSLAAGRGGGGGGGGRGGGGGFSRQGPASGGDFSPGSSNESSNRGAETSGPDQDASRPSASTSDSPPLSGSRPPAGNRPPDGTRPPDATRPPVGNRPPPPPGGRPLPPPPYGGNDGGDWDHYDDGAVFVAGVVVGSAIGASAAYYDDESTGTSTDALPCDPTIMDVDGVAYYQCGSTFYVEAYGGDGPIYVPVPPPG